MTLTGQTITLGAPTAIEMVADPNTGALTASAVSLPDALGANGTLSAADLQALQTANVTRFRYDFASTSTVYAPGTVTVSVAQGAWKDSNGDPAPAATFSYQVLGPTVQLVQPTNGSGIDINTLNGRTYIDVPISVPEYAPANSIIDWSAITSTTPIFSLSGAGVGTATIDATQAPVILSESTDKTSGTVRYWVSGSFASGDVDAVFVAGGPPITEDLGTVSGGTVPVEVDVGPETIDVPFPTGPSGDEIDPGSLISGGQFTLSGPGLGTVQIDPTFEPTVVGNGFTVRYHVIGTFADGEVDATFTGSWSVVPIAGGSASVQTGGSAVVDLGTTTAGSPPPFGVEGEALDVTFPVPAGTTIDPSSLNGFGQITLGGGGLGTVTLDQGYAPQLLPDGQTVEYRITGAFQSGDVTAGITPGSFEYLDPAVAVAAETQDLGSSLSTEQHTYLDVSLAPTIGGSLASNLTLSSSDLSFTGSGVGTATVDSQTPLSLGGNRYRFFIDGAFTTGEVDVTFAAGSFTDSNNYPNAQASATFTVLGPTATLAGPASDSTTGANGLDTEGYIDVPFNVPVGSMLDTTTIANASAVFTISGATGFTVDPTKAPVFISQTGNTVVYRYWTIGSYTSGTVEITFLNGGYGFVGGPPSTFLGPVAPVNFTVDGVATPNIHYIDVQLTPTAGDTLDVSSIDDTTPEFTLSGSGVGTAQLLADATPTLLPGGSTFRYYLSGAFAPGEVDVDFIAGSFSSSSPVHPLGFTNLAKSDSFTVQQLTATIADPQPGGITGVDTLNDRSFVDVTFTLPAGADTIDVSSVTDSAITIAPVSSSSGTIAVDTTETPILISQNGTSYVFRFFTTGTMRSGAVTITYNPGSITFLSAGDQSVTPTGTYVPTGVLSGDSYLDVQYATAAGIPLDPSTIDGNEFALGGTGVGTAQLVACTTGSTTCPTIIGNGLVRYYISGQFTPGIVSVTFAAGSWQDSKGDPGLGSTQTFTLIDQVPAPGSSTTDSRVFFIALSGGVNLQAGGLFGDSPTQPLLSITGAVELTIGTKTLSDGSTQTRFELTASGTVNVIKIGNIASGAAVFVLQTGSSLSSVQFYGVAAIQTNFDFLEPYGVYLSGSALLEINTTSTTQTETISLAGVPGDAIFTAPTANLTSLVGALPGDTFDEVALSSSWTSLFAAPGTNPTSLTLDNGRTINFTSFSGITLQNAQVEGVIAGAEWKVINGDGSEYFIQTEADQNGNPILVVSGEARTYNLAPVSFEVEVVGGATIYDPSTLSPGAADPTAGATEWMHMDGGFLLKITASQTTFFFTAGGTIDPLALSGRVTGLLLINYPVCGDFLCLPGVDGAGIAGEFSLEIGAGTGPTSPGDDSSALSDITGIFSFQGSVKVTLNTTLADQSFTVPQEFLSVLPSGFPSPIVIPAAAPQIDGSVQASGHQAGYYIQAIVTGGITLEDIITFAGTIAVKLQVGDPNTDPPTPSFVRIQGAVSTNIPFLGELSGSIDLGFYTSRPDGTGPALNPGIIGRVTLARDSSAIPEVDLSGDFLLEVNLFASDLTTPGETESTVTFLTNEDVNPTGCADDNGVNDCYQVVTQNNTIQTGTVAITPGLYLLLSGELTIANLVDIQGTFTFTFDPNPFVIQVTADATIGLQGFGTLGAFSGAFRIDSDGLELAATISVNADFGEALGLQFTASATINFSTAAATKTIALGDGSKITVNPGFLLSISGTIDFVGIVSASGSAEIAISGTAFTIQFALALTLGPIVLNASGFAGIYNDPSHDDVGLVLQLDVGINFDILDIVTIKGTGEIRLNTTDQDHVANGVTLGHNSFRLHIDGTVSLLSVINLTTSVDVIVGGDVHMQGGSGNTAYNETVGEGDWFFLFTGNADFFGLATLSASGWVDSAGHFGIDLNGGITIGSSSFGLSGNFDISAWLTQDQCNLLTDPGQIQSYCNGDTSSSAYYYSFGVSFSATVGVNAFGFSLASVGIGATITAAGAGTVDLVASVEVHIHILFFSFSATANFDIGTVQLPRPIFLAGEEGSNASIGNSAWNATAINPEPLYLNMGSRAAATQGFEGRGVGEDQQDESFTIDNVSGTAKDETVTVTAFGHQQTFSHVSAIYAYGGSGNDTIVVDKGVLAPVVMDGGDGYDNLLYDGSGGATIYGNEAGTDSDSDVIIVGPDAGGPITVDGGAGGDYIVDNSSDPGVTLNGGPDGDSITGGFGANDVLNGNGGNDVIQSRGPSDHINGGSGDDTITLNMPSGVFPTISGGGGNDTLVISDTDSADTVHVYKPTDGNDIEVDALGGPATGGKLQASAFHTVGLNTDAGADNVTIDNLQDSSVESMSVDVGAGDDTFTLSGDDPTTGVQITQVVAGDSNWIGQFTVLDTVRANDSLIIDGEGGTDTIDASLLGTDSMQSTPSLNPVDLVALTIEGGAGNDRLIGSPFNDVIDGGTGTDTMTGGLGLDTFKSENTTAIDTLIETQNTDLGLFGNTFITGVALADNGVTPYATNAGTYETEDQLASDMQNEDNPTTRQPGSGEYWAAGATVENIQGIFSTAQLTGGAGNNTIVVNDLDSKIYVGGVTRTVTTWNGEALLDNSSNTANALPEYYVLTIVPGSTAEVDIVDSGGGTGTDDLVVFGSNQPDTLELDATGAGAATVGFIQASVTSTEAISFSGVERLEIYTLGGNDSILSNDTAVTTVIDEGSGDDSIVVGTVPLVPDPGNRTLQYPNGVPVADTAHMTNGNTAPLYVLGNTGDDYFEVDHNVGLLYLAGDAGDDTFLINTFLVLKQNPDKPDEITNLTTLFGGSGSNRYEYLQNAPVSINGGSGYDTIIIDGTPLDDTFIVTNNYIAGAGRIVSFTNIEAIEVEGGGGDDDIWILSTNPALTVTVDGGSGDDTIHIGGTPPPLVFDPPPFTYTPPAYTVVTPELVYETFTYNLGGYSFAVPLTTWFGLGGGFGTGSGVTSAGTMLLDQRFGATSGGPVTATIGTISAYLDWNVFDFFDLFPYVLVTVSSFQVSYQIPTIQYVTRTIQPPSITVTPAPVALVAPPSIDASQVKSQVIILGGDQFETSGDTVIYGDEGGAADTGQLVQRVVPRMEETGEEPDGTPIFAPETDPTTHAALTDTYVSLESTALGISPSGQTSAEGTPYYGIEMQGIEHVELRLSNASAGDNFTIDDTAICTGAGTSNCIEDAPGALPAPTVDVYGGTSSDTFTVAGIGAATTITGGPGNDTVTVESAAQNLTGILSRLTIDGNDMLSTQTTQVQSNDSEAIVQEFLNTPILVIATGNAESADGQTYYQAAWVSIICAVNQSAFCTDPNSSTGAVDVRSGVIDAASITPSNQTLTVHNRSPVVLNSTVVVADPASGTLSGASVNITDFVAGDVLAANTSGTQITATYSNGALVLQGVDTLAHYQQVLRSVTYSSTAADPTNGGTDPTRSIHWQVGSGDLVQVNVQEKGTPVTGVQMYGAQVVKPETITILGFQITIQAPVFVDVSGNETFTNTGVQEIQQLNYGTAGAVPIYLDTQGNDTTTNTGIPVILSPSAATGGQPVLNVYVDPTFQQVFSQYGSNLLSDGDFSTQVGSSGSTGAWTAANVDSNGGWRSSGGDPGGYYILNSNGAASTDPTLTQTLTGLLPGVTYQIDGDFMNVYPQYGNSPNTPSFGVYVNGGLVYSSTQAAAPQGTWKHFTTTFTVALSGTTATILFAGEQNGQDASYAIDNLMVRAINTQAYTTNFANGTDLYVDGSGRKTTVNTGLPSLVPIYETQLEPFDRTADVASSTYNGQPIAGHDTLNIVSTGSSSNLTATLDTYTVPVDEISNGQPVLHNDGLPGGTETKSAEVYFGGEPVIDPLTGAQLYYSGGEPVLDLFTGQEVKDPSGTVLTHNAGDPMLHIAGDPVVQPRGSNVEFLGGEQVVDENGNPVYTGNEPFTDLPGQAEIANRGQQVYELVQASGPEVAIGAANFTPPSESFTTLASGATLNIQTLTHYTLQAGSGLLPTDQVTVLVYDGTDIYQLSQSQYSVNFATDTVTINAIATKCLSTNCVTVKVVIETPEVHTASQAEQYTGNEPVVAGQPIVDAEGHVQLDKNGNLIVYTSSQTTQTVDESYYWNPSGSPPTQTIHLNEVPISGFTVAVGTTTLTTADYTLSGSTLALHPTESGLKSSTSFGDSIAIAYVGAVLHARGEPVYTCNVGANTCTQVFYTVGSPVLTLGDEPVLYTGGQQAYYTNAQPIQLATPESHITVASTTGGGMAGDIIYSGLSAVNLSLGSGNDLVTVVTTHTGTTTINTGSGNDEVAVRSINGATAVLTGGGSDTIDVGTEAGYWPTVGQFTDVKGNANSIDAQLTIDGGTGAGTDMDTVTVDDTTDSAANTAVLMSSMLTGIFGTGGLLDYFNLETLNVNLGNGANTFEIQSTHTGTTNVNTGNGGDTVNIETTSGTTNVTSGSGNDLFRVGSTTANAGDPTATSVLDSISGGWLTINGGGGSNTLKTYDGDETIANTGVLTSSTYTGDGMALGIQYQNFLTLDLRLSNGADNFFVSSTPLGSTLDLYGGDEPAILNQYSDVIDVASTGGAATIEGGAGNDIIRVNYDQLGNQTFENGIGGPLLLEGDAGGDLYQIGLSGLPGQTGSLDTTITVSDSVTAGDINQLTIYGTNNPEYYLLRANQEEDSGMVAAFGTDANDQPLLNGVMERVNYDASMNGGLTIYGGTSNDTFVLDDNLAPTTIFGDAGDDTFQVGQVFQSPRDGTNPNNGLDPMDYFATTQTTQGYLSNGVSYATTLYGGTGDDDFTVYHNLAELWLYGQEDNDTFTIRSFVKVNPNDPQAPFTNINGGAGADFISYTVDAPVRIDGGDGLDTVVVLGTDDGDTFVITDQGVFGAGLSITWTNIEKVIVDGGSGNDTFYVQSTSPTVQLELVGGQGSDTFDIGGGNGDQPITVVSNNPNGHSGLIAQLVSSADAAYDGLAMPGISATVGDANAPGVVISQSAPLTVFESANAPSGLVVDTYTVVLTEAPTEDVIVTAAATALSQEEQKAGAKNIFLNGEEGGTTLLFTRDNWFVPQTVVVTAEPDGVAEGNRSIAIQHTVVEGSSPNDGDPYDGLSVASVAVDVIDADTASVVVAPYNEATNQAENQLLVAEDPSGSLPASDAYAVALSKQPTGPVTFEAASDGDTLLWDPSTSTWGSTVDLTFTPQNWNDLQIVRIEANDASTTVGLHFSRITNTIVSDSGAFLGLTAGDVASGLATSVNSDPTGRFQAIAGHDHRPGVHDISLVGHLGHAHDRRVFGSGVHGHSRRHRQRPDRRRRHLDDHARRRAVHLRRSVLRHRPDPVQYGRRRRRPRRRGQHERHFRRDGERRDRERDDHQRGRADRRAVRHEPARGRVGNRRAEHVRLREARARCAPERHCPARRHLVAQPQCRHNCCDRGQLRVGGRREQLDAARSGGCRGDGQQHRGRPRAPAHRRHERDRADAVRRPRRRLRPGAPELRVPGRPDVGDVLHRRLRNLRDQLHDVPRVDRDRPEPRPRQLGPRSRSGHRRCDDGPAPHGQRHRHRQQRLLRVRGHAVHARLGGRRDDQRDIGHGRRLRVRRPDHLGEPPAPLQLERRPDRAGSRLLRSVGRGGRQQYVARRLPHVFVHVARRVLRRGERMAVHEHRSERRHLQPPGLGAGASSRGLRLRAGPGAGQRRQRHARYPAGRRQLRQLLRLLQLERRQRAVRRLDRLADAVRRDPGLRRRHLRHLLVHDHARHAEPDGGSALDDDAGRERAVLHLRGSPARRHRARGRRVDDRHPRSRLRGGRRADRRSRPDRTGSRLAAERRRLHRVGEHHGRRDAEHLQRDRVQRRRRHRQRHRPARAVRRHRHPLDDGAAVRRHDADDVHQRDGDALGHADTE